MRRLGIVVVAEDENLRRFLVPAIQSVARASGVFVDVVRSELTHGCRVRKLREILGMIRESGDIVVVGADTSGPDHRRHRISHRQKRHQLSAAIASSREISFAMADPSSEAWLLADATAFTTGIEAALASDGRSQKFVRPARWPTPVGEQKAKSELGRVVRDGLGAVLARSGFEFADEIVSRADLFASPNASLGEWAREFRLQLERARDAE